MKLAFVVGRFGIDIIGGAEFLARKLAEHLMKYFDVEVLTTCAKDYHSWRNEYPEEVDKGGVPVKRFKVNATRDLNKFIEFQNRILGRPHTVKEELTWLHMQGPYVPRLIEYLQQNKNEYDFFVFFSYRYFYSYYGIKAIPQKSILIPTAEDDLALNFEIFRDLFHVPRCIVYLTEEEKRLVQNKFQNKAIPHDVIAIGIDPPPAVDGKAFRDKYEIQDEFVLYTGRIDGSKGCYQLFDYFKTYKKHTSMNTVKLVLDGPAMMHIPKSEDIVLLGPLSEEDKFSAMKEARALIHPSQFESLSIVTLECMSVGTPVLVNGQCAVTKGHCVRSNGGLYYTNYEEFEACLDIFFSSEELRNKLGANGKKYVQQNYDWRKVEEKYRALIEKAYCRPLGHIHSH